jgi:hypothetical protein
MLLQHAHVRPDEVTPITEAAMKQPCDRSLAIRRILYELRGADSGDGEVALERAERQLAALMCDGDAA